PDHAADQQLRRELVLQRGRRVDALGDEDDRERVRARPEEERDLPPHVALDEVPVALDDAAEADELVSDSCCSLGDHYANTSRSLSPSVPSANVRPVAAKNASSSVSTRNRSLTSSTGSRNSSSPRSSRPTRSASASASSMSWVQSRIVASCSVRISR